LGSYIGYFADSDGHLWEVTAVFGALCGAAGRDDRGATDAVLRGRGSWWAFLPMRAG